MKRRERAPILSDGWSAMALSGRSQLVFVSNPRHGLFGEGACHSQRRRQLERRGVADEQVPKR